MHRSQFIMEDTDGALLPVHQVLAHIVHPVEVRDIVIELVKEVPLAPGIDQAVGVIEHPDSVKYMKGRLLIRHLPPGNLPLHKKLGRPALAEAMIGDLKLLARKWGEVINRLVACNLHISKGNRKVNRQLFFSTNFYRDHLQGRARKMPDRDQ